MLKKYPNRRLYDCTQGCYVRISEVRDRLIGGEIVKTTAGEDVTAEILATLIREDVTFGKARLGNGPSAEALRQFIREYSIASARPRVAQAM